MTNNKHLSTWLGLGVGRGVALSKALDCSRQYVEKMKNGSMSSKQWEAFIFAMSIVELDERRNTKKIEQNIIKSAHAIHSKDMWIKRFAEAELDKWVEALKVTL
ncbi:hypothetical protein [uncultured Acinetobacter sp.]|uniref:hypothetical protein n=1 Tax=uncultured Acinetobacter sp. TaxID=165433 RepID=UPI002584E741|nr:hypothetical protein [uncultured Acinetobacter sp.]